MKNCEVCGYEFKSYNGIQKVCPKDECRKEQARRRQQKYYAANPEAYRDNSRRWRAKNPGGYEWPAKRELGEEIRRLKEETPCSDCGNNFPFECMDFDHVRGEKVNNVGTMVAHGWSRERIHEEIAKCDIVCANCHRIRTRKRRLHGSEQWDGLSGVPEYPSAA